MRVVIDTNVLVSGLIKKQGTPPAVVVDDLFANELTLLYDERILAEYREVFARPKLRRIPPQEAAELLDLIVRDGVEVPAARFPGQLPDPKDQPFADVAFTGKADLLITGNIKDFPVGDAIRVVTPRQWVDLKQSAPGG